ncbi:MAG: winged helix-turn-helix domain-containing protein [Rhodospirillales bacterium]|nr:winged helix-turn-helix domain-containing protein [Rhodospirillales bacterium]
MNETLPRLLLRLSEAEPPVLWGRVAAPYYGREFERLLAERILIEEAPAETWDVCSSCECGLDVRPIQRINGRLVAACPHDNKFDLVLSDEDIRSYRIDPALLAQKIATASGMGDAIDEILPGLWRLGPGPNGRAVFLALSTAAILQPGLLGMMTRSARGSAITLLTTREMPMRRQMDDAGFHLVALLDALGHDPKSSFALDLNRLIPVLVPKLRLICSRMGVVLHGNEGTLSKRPFDLLCVLAKAKGAVVKRRDIESCLWTQPVDKGSVSDAVRDLREKLEAINPGGKALIESKAGQGYRLALDAHEITIS